jgi:hypothetical protein
MKYIILVLGLAVLSILGFRYYSYFEPVGIPSPNPPLSHQESLSDRPVWTHFEGLGFRDITRKEAVQYWESGTRGRIGSLWGENLKSLRSGDSVQISGPLLGRSGLCEWYRFRILDPLGREVAGYGRAGPRRVGQLQGGRQASQSLLMRMVTGDDATQANELRGDYSEFLTSEDPAYRSAEVKHEEDLARLREHIQKAAAQRAQNKSSNPKK